MERQAHEQALSAMEEGKQQLQAELQVEGTFAHEAGVMLTAAEGLAAMLDESLASLQPQVGEAWVRLSSGEAARAVLETTLRGERERVGELERVLVLSINTATEALAEGGGLQSLVQQLWEELMEIEGKVPYMLLSLFHRSPWLLLSIFFCLLVTD